MVYVDTNIRNPTIVPLPERPLARLIHTGLDARTGIILVSINWYVLLSENVDVNSDIDKTLGTVDFLSDLYTTRYTAARFRIAHQDPCAALTCTVQQVPFHTLDPAMSRNTAQKLSFFRTSESPPESL